MGFKEDSGSGRGGHYKYIHLSKRPLVTNQRPFIMVPRHNISQNLAIAIGKQAKMFDISNEDIEACCKEHR